jgi:hypothetical protein
MPDALKLGINFAAFVWIHIFNARIAQGVNFVVSQNQCPTA